MDKETFLYCSVSFKHDVAPLFKITIRKILQCFVIQENHIDDYSAGKKLLDDSSMIQQYPYGDNLRHRTQQFGKMFIYQYLIHTGSTLSWHTGNIID